MATARGSALASRAEDREPWAARRRRVLEAAAAVDCRAVLAYSPARFSLLELDALWWSVGWRPQCESAAVIGPDDAVRCFVTCESDMAEAVDMIGDGVRLVDGELFAAVAAWVDRSGLYPGELLFCGESRLSARRHDEMARGLGESWRSGDRLLAELSRRRDELELELASRATEIAEEGYRRFLDDLRSGMAEYEAVALLDGHLRELGSDDNFVLVSAGQQNRSVHPPTDRTIERGDVLLAEVSPSCAGVFTQICRTVTIGPRRAEVQRDYEMLTEALRAGMRVCSPSTPVAEVVTAMNAVIAAAGFEDYCRPPYMRARGHGLGIGSVLPGDVTSSSDETLEEGDLLVLHPNQYLPTSGYLLCGEPIVVEQAGPRLLSEGVAELQSVMC